MSQDTAFVVSTADSPAVDAGVPVPWATDDRDGNRRPDCAAWDIGAYEVQGSPCWEVYLPLVLKNH